MKQTIKKFWFLVVLAVLLTGVSFLASTTQNVISDDVVYVATEKMELTLIIDAGHGGEDGGAVSISGAKESEINLEIAKRLDLIMGFYGVNTLMTRDSEVLSYSKNADTIKGKKNEDQKKRIQLVNETENAILISIHQNKFPDGGPFGAQVLFAPTNGSKDFGENMQKMLVDTLNTKNRRTASKVPNNILLMNRIKCPAILVECGFLSNREEEKKLLSDQYQLKIAAVIALGYLNNQNSLNQIYSGGTNEG